MRLYFADTTSPFLPLPHHDDWNIRNILVSYYIVGSRPIPEDPSKLMHPDRKFFLDSGAFSAFTKDVKIDIDAYIAYIKTTMPVWEVYATLDVIGDAIATRKNTEYMEAAGLKPLPVFHAGSPAEELDHILKNYDYFALGGLVPLAMHRKKLRAWLDYCFARIMQEEKLPKVHGFGVNSLWAWKRYPFYSVDATSWKAGMQYGRVAVRNGMNVETASKNDDKHLLRHFHGKTWKDRTSTSVKTWLELEKMITELWKYRGITWEE